ncbi:hypothetical protein C8F01DRAFT_178059 [Mycena amicta]|nr:hypothetical protein C8F01DRAFT_178059 [Mycena amicta]
MLAHIRGFLRALFSPWASLPEVVEESHIIPCTGMDIAMRNFVLTTGFVVDKRLDAKRLEETLWLVIEKKFPRAGARWMQRKGVHEFHVPKTFDASTPPVAFTANDYPELYASDPTRPPIDHLRRATDDLQPFVCPPTPPAFDELFLASMCPRTAAGFLGTGKPLLQVHVSVFDDVTFIGVSAAHLLLDALGTSALIRGWTMVLNGESIDNVHGMALDDRLAVHVVSDKALKHSASFAHAMSPLSSLSFLLRMVYRFWRDRVDETRYVCVPKTFLVAKKREIMDELKAQGSTEWVGSSDVLYAWWLKGFASNFVSDNTSLYPQILFDLRDRPIFAPQGIPLASPYINNAISHVYVPPLTFADVRTSSLRELALHIRRANTKYTSDPALVASDVAWRLDNPLAPEFPCPPGALWEVQSDWRKAKFAEMDFSGAMPVLEDDSNSKARVKFVSVGMLTDIPLPVLRGTHYVLMEDESALWMCISRGSKEWNAMQRVGRVRFL